jgi:hypothetical protein
MEIENTCTETQPHLVHFTYKQTTTQKVNAWFGFHIVTIRTGFKSILEEREYVKLIIELDYVIRYGEFIFY